MSTDVKEGKVSLVRLAGFFGVLGSVLPVIMVLAATVLSSWFRWDTNALSELGVGEQAALFNSAVLLGGVLNFLFAIGLWQYLNKERLVKAGIVSIMVSSISLALVGIFTINYLAWHGVAAFGYFVFAPLGMLLIGFGTKESAVKKLSIGCGLSALMAILVLPVIIFGLSFKIGFAVPEETEALIIAVWTLFMAAKLMRPKKGISNYR
jgi:hypothetical membrane protein